MFKRLSLILIVGFTAACGGIPTTSAIYQGEDSQTATQQVIRVIARPPVDGMAPDAVVRGFLNACADSAEDFAIAREYLTGAVQQNWNPNTGTQIYDSNRLSLTTTGEWIMVTAPLDSTITTAGKLAYNETDNSVSQQYKLVKDSTGQWRIAELPNGLLLSRNDFDRSYRAFPTYFYGEKPNLLIPDFVMLAGNTTSNATTLTRALLAGPSSELQPTLTSAIPLDTKLTYSGVPVNNGIAQVDLSEEILSADKTTREKISAQLVWTLTSLPGVSGVRIMISGQQFEVPGISGVQVTSDWNQYAPDPKGQSAALYSVTGANIVKFAENESTIVARANMAVGDSLNSAQISLQRDQFAAIGQDGKQLLLSEPSQMVMNLIHTGSTMSRPAWTARNEIVVADYGNGITAYSSQGEVIDIQLETTPLGSESDIKSIAIAPDGVRIALVFSAGDTDRLALGTITWTDVGISIQGTRKIENSISQISDITWAHSQQLQLLGSIDNGSTALIGLAIGTGQWTTSSAPVGAQTLAVGANSAIYVGVTDGDAAAIVKQEFGPWVKVIDAAAPFAVIE